MLEPAVLLFEIFEARGIGDLHATILRAPIVKYGIADAMHAAKGDYFYHEDLFFPVRVQSSGVTGQRP